MEKDAGDYGPDLGEDENLSSFSIRKGPQLVFCCDLGREKKIFISMKVKIQS